MNLIPVQALAAKEAEFDARRGQLPEHYDLSLLAASGIGRVLKFYLLLTDMPYLLANDRFSEEQR